MRISLSVVVALCLCATAFGSGPIILINPSNPQVALGATTQLSADRAVQTGNGQIIDFGIDKAVTWSSSSAAIASVNSNGMVTGIAPGVASITASIDQAPFHASTQVTVVAQSNFFVYVPNEVSADISGYSAAAGSLTSIVGAPFATGGSNPVNIAADPAGKFAYVTDIANDNLYGYQINPSNGILSPIAGFPFPVGYQPRAELVDPSGHYLYVGNSSSNNISVYQIGMGGTLTEIQGSPFPAGLSVYAMAIDHTGKFLYAANYLDDSLSAYNVASDGSLTPLSGSPYVTPRIPAAVVVDPLNRFVFVTTLGTETVTTFLMNNSTGTLTESVELSLPESTGAVGIVVDPTGRFAYVADQGTSNVAGYSLDPAVGALQPLPESPFEGVSNPFGIAMDSSGTDSAWTVSVAL